MLTEALLSPGFSVSVSETPVASQWNAISSSKLAHWVCSRKTAAANQQKDTAEMIQRTPEYRLF